MFKLFLVLAFFDAEGDLQTRTMQYNLTFPSLIECQEQMRESMGVTEDIVRGGGLIASVSYSCVYDMDTRNTETET